MINNCSDMLKPAVTTLLTMMVATPVLAHPGHMSVNDGAFEGLIHPLTGMDHLIALTAMGVLGATLAGKTAVRLSLFLLGALVIGFIAGGWFGAAGWMEPTLVGSVIVMGLLVAFAHRTSIVAPVVVAAVAGVHGYAHGAEMPADAAIPFLLGFVVSSAALFMAGRLGALYLVGVAGKRCALGGLGCVTALAGLILAVGLQG